MKYKLGEICEIVSGSTPKTGIEEYWDGDNKWITPAELTDDSYIIEDSARKLTELGVKKTGLTPFPAGTVILSSRAPIGKVAIAGCEMYCNQGFKNLICSDKINNKYLYWFLKGNTAFLNSLGRGATFKEISKGIVSDIEINVPDAADQDKAVLNLEKISEIIKLRKKELEKFDELIKARFVEMFGDPVNNSNNYSTFELNDVCIKITDGTHDTPERFSEGRLLITGKNIRATGIIFDEIEYVSEEDHRVIYERCNPEYEDVLYTNIGVNYGTACLNDLDYEFSMKNVALLKPNKKIINGYYLWICLNLMRDYILSMNQVGGAQTFMGLATIKKIKIPIPPLDLQKKFVGIIKQVDKSKVVVEKNWNIHNVCLIA